MGHYSPLIYGHQCHHQLYYMVTHHSNKNKINPNLLICSLNNIILKIIVAYTFKRQRKEKSKKCHDFKKL